MSEKRSLIEQMLEHLVNDEQQKAEELFHEYVVKQSREIYETLIESEMKDEEDEDEDKKEDEVEEGFGEFDDVVEADDEMDLDSEDPTDDLAGELDGEEGEKEVDDRGEEELFMDLEAIVDELQAKFDELKGHEEAEGEIGGDDEMGNDEEMKDDFELETVREYVEKVPAGHGAEKKGQAEKADGSATGLKFSKNDMGGTASNILSGRNGADAGEVGSSCGAMKGSALSDVKPKDMNTGNLNKVGGFKGDAFKKNNAGHGAERKGAAEGPTEAQGLFRGRR